MPLTPFNSQPGRKLMTARQTLCYSRTDVSNAVVAFLLDCRQTLSGIIHCW